MEDIILTRREIKHRDNNPINRHYKGAYGSCSSYNDGLLKIFHTKMEPQHIINLENNLKRQSKIVMYPRCKVLEKETGDIRGYYMDMAPGMSLLTLRNKILSKRIDMTLDEFLSLYYDCFLKELKKEEVLIFDMKDCQIFVDDNLYLTDTDSFLSLDDESVQMWLNNNRCDSAFQYNTKHINEVIISFLSFIGNGYVNVNEEIKSENYLYKYVDEIYKKTNNKVKTLGEYSRYKE